MFKFHNESYVSEHFNVRA